MTIGNEEYISTLEDLSSDLEKGYARGEGGFQLEALEAAQEALAFGQALWNLFEDQALHTGDKAPDYDMMLNYIDALNGELAAAVLFLVNNKVDATRALNMAADNLEKMETESVEIPLVVLKGYRRLAKRVKNTQAILNARNITKLVPSK